MRSANASDASDCSYHLANTRARHSFGSMYLLHLGQTQPIHRNNTLKTSTSAGPWSRGSAACFAGVFPKKHEPSERPASTTIRQWCCTIFFARWCCNWGLLIMASSSDLTREMNQETPRSPVGFRNLFLRRNSSSCVLQRTTKHRDRPDDRDRICGIIPSMQQVLY